jgi:hypothetical protein
MDAPLMAFLRRYRKGIDFTDGEIIYCLKQIESYDKFNKEIDSKLAKDLIPFKSYLISLRRLRNIDKILK